MSASVVSVISRFLEEYLSSTPQRLKLLDAYLLYILLTGAPSPSTLSSLASSLVWAASS
ncbi:defender against cell death 1, isoform CRA_b [Rattus norvegicus]|uniref:Defender against cell death 1, isoform CRA_b n=1 Tax=Rattus norvegicus TaxID=10116 RepID=A6KGR9_RAT|nr:defender against cell death 1, isoform CRA_b [Rattus norvegicus]